MKVYIVTRDYQNDLSYEDYDRGCGEFIGVAISLDKAICFIDSHIAEKFGDNVEFIEESDERCVVNFNSNSEEYTVYQKIFLHDEGLYGEYLYRYYVQEIEIV